MESLRVALLPDSGSRAYPIHIGADLLGDAALYAPYHSGSAAIVTNSVVAPLYLATVRRALEAAGARVADVVLEDGEQAKRWESVQRICDALLAARLGRDTLVVALGGGVVGDLAGFTAAVYQRGVQYLQVPTTLLAQVDSAVGGKTAINHKRGKNLIGAFHQPRAVISDTGTLDSLPGRELKAGLAEVIKHGFALDLPFVEWLEASMEALVAREPQALAYAIRRCCELKAAVVAIDERETGQRALLNFGHTFGHAIETGVGYGEWLHGEAVAAGMVMASALSARLGLLAEQDVERVRALLRRAGLPVRGPELPPARMLELMAVDKKALQGHTRFVVLEAVGRAALRGNIDAALVGEAIAAAQ